MSVLDFIAEMQSQGLSDSEIQENLKQQGFSPKEMREAFEQMRVRAEVAQEYENTPVSDEGFEKESNENQATGDYYSNDQPEAVSSEVVNEIVEQAVAGKFSEINKNISSLSFLKNNVESQLQQIDARVKKLEENFENLQRAILGRIGGYGTDIKSIKEEMGMMQESFSKMLNPIMDKSRKITASTEEIPENNNASKESNGESNTENEEGNLGREHFNFDLLRKIGKGDQ